MLRRTRLLGWLLIAAAPAFFLLTIEGAVRLFDISPAFERDAAVPPWLDRNILAKDARWMELLASSPRELRNYYSTYEWDRLLFYRLRPNLAIPLTDALAPPAIRDRTRWTLRTNSRGFPGPEVSDGPHPGVYRILSMGDSSTFGWGVESDEAYPALLGRELARRHPGARIEVVNLGVCGYSSLQGKILLEREGLKYAPDLVTLSYGSNDFSRVPEPFDEIYRRNTSWTGEVRAFLHRSRAYQIYSAFLAKILRSGGETTASTAAMPLNVGPEKSEANLIAMIGAARGGGADSVLVTNCVPGEMAQPMREAASKSATPLVDSEAILRAAIPAQRAGGEPDRGRARLVDVYGEETISENPDLEVYLADRCHPNVVGHQLLARALADAVERAPSFSRIAGGAGPRQGPKNGH